MPRPYRLKRRAQRQAETRRRIVDATVELHRTIGPSRTTISAIAERAGVQRLTVYRHFPDERAMMIACSGQYMSEHPPPNPETWMTIDNEQERLRQALLELYDYYDRTEEMMSNLLRDRDSNPIVREMLQPYDQFLAISRDILSRGWQVTDDGARMLDAAIGHALDFHAWRSLTRGQGLTREEAVTLMTRSIVHSVED